MFCKTEITQLVNILYLTSFTQSAVQLEKRQSSPQYSGDVRHKVKMGEANVACDDGVNRLDVDWFDSPVNYTCYHPTRPLLPIKSSSPKVECTNPPSDYSPQHFCMNQVIKYNTTVPTHGDHRPIWPKFGEYRFVPVQRWLHNIEHGAVVMLYHPCTHPATVDKLRRIVKGCIRKHVITPYTNLPEDRPLALVAWGCRMLMSDVDPDQVKQFIKSYGLKGPEGTYPKEGQYVHELLHLAEAPPGSDMNDTKLCPNIP